MNPWRPDNARNVQTLLLNLPPDLPFSPSLSPPCSAHLPTTCSHLPVPEGCQLMRQRIGHSFHMAVTRLYAPACCLLRQLECTNTTGVHSLAGTCPSESCSMGVMVEAKLPHHSLWKSTVPSQGHSHYIHLLGSEPPQVSVVRAAEVLYHRLWKGVLSATSHCIYLMTTKCLKCADDSPSLHSVRVSLINGAREQCSVEGSNSQ